MAELDDVAQLARGRGGPDLQDDVIDSQQNLGIEHEERALAEEQQLEQLDILEGLRQMQTADPIRWKVHRSGHEEAKYNGYLGELPTTSLTMENIRKKYGGGNYRVRGTFSNGKYATQRQFTIAGESILYIPVESNGASAMQGAAPSQFNLSEFMSAQEMRDEKRREAEQRRADEEDRRAERRAKENRDFILAIGAVVAPVITAVVTRVAPTPAPATDVAALVTALRKDTPTESPISGMKGMLEIMTMMRELMPGGDSGGSDTVEMVKAVAGIAGPALQAFTANRAQNTNRPRARVAVDPTQQPSTVPVRPAPVTIEAVPVAAAPAVRQPVPGEAPTLLQPSAPSQNSGVDLSAPSQPMTVEQSNMFAQLKPQVDALVQMARDGQDATAVGDMFYDQYLSTADDDMYDRLCSLFENSATIDQIALFNTGVRELRPWFETLQAAIVKKIKLEEAQATISNPQASEGEEQSR